MLPTAFVATASRKDRRRALVFFGGDTIWSRNDPIEYGSTNSYVSNMCVDVRTGSVHFMSLRGGLHPKVHKPGGGGILEWFEAYADALDSAYYKVVQFPDVFKAEQRVAGISFIPMRPPGQVSRVTWGVRVTVSVIFLPDDLLLDGGQYNFAYKLSSMLQHAAHLP
ncbi:hypothetical protein COCOBI_15-4150 [Coccomyxa sp. Obi]|nr:hypothetical protein COCOBI_15-4150 [Coccomyxa sp. Obi]